MAPKTEKSELQLEELLLEIQDITEDINDTLKLGESLSGDLIKINKFKARISRIDSAWRKFSSLVIKAKLLATSLDRQDDLDNLKKLTCSVRNDYYDALALYNPYHSEHDSSEQNISSANNIQSVLGFKLPTLTIPTFDGDVSSWNSFKDTYSSLIHDNPDLSPIQKYHYLKSSLKGNALQSISAIPVTSDTYAQAWSILINKYDSKRLQATNYLTKLFNFKPLSKGNFSSLEQFSRLVLESSIAFRNIKLRDPAGFILTTFALRLLDSKTREKFETAHSDTEEIEFTQFVEFIHKQCTLLQTDAFVAGLDPSPSVVSKFQNKHPKCILMSTSTNPEKACPLCKSNHRLFRCSIFKRLTPFQRWEKVKASNSCTNCLSPSHTNSKCTSTGLCRYCNLKHHSWLHFKTSKDSQVNKPYPITAPNQSLGTTNKPNVSENVPTSSGTVLSSVMSGGTFVLLGTALARIQTASGDFLPVRLVIDSGSQRSIITESCAKRLGLKRSRNSQGLLGLANNPIKGSEFQVRCLLIPRHKDQPQLQTDAVVVKQITSHMPSFQLPWKIKQGYDNLELADPTFYNPGQIDFLLGADLFGSVVCGGSITMPKGYPNAISTIFGSVILGNVENCNYSCTPATSLLINSNLPQLIERFWQVEEVNSPIVANPDDTQCEDYFVNTHSRTDKGKYVVRLPFKDPANVTLGDSYCMALNRFRNLEKRLIKFPSFKTEYSHVLQEYLDKQYMIPAVNRGAYILPHHGVFKDSTTTKLRVVFDASMKTSEGSLNDHLLIGPKLHLDIREVIMNFRRHPIVLTADICQMFLQILIHPDDRKFQHILYSFETSGLVREYELNTLTFGMSSSPYLALRVLRQLSQDEGRHFPRAAQVLLHEIYVDDILTGAKSVESAVDLQKQLVELLGKGGFTLKKWSSNSPEVLKHIPDENRGPITFSAMEDTCIKILGMIWDPVTDDFSFNIKLPKVIFTKRSVLSIIARLFDPLGYLAPVIFKAKAFMQELWTLKLDWDTPLPEPLKKRWAIFMEELPLLSAIKIARCILPVNPSHISVVGFADASSLGYASVIYLRVVDDAGETRIYLLTAKTRLAPLKTLSIPRLELCAAQLLAKTLSSCKDFFSSLNISSFYLFSDSSTVLGWLSVPPHTLKVFIANRAVNILQQTLLNNWYHVRSADNPADRASRGETPANLHHQTFWWQGPQWLKEDPLTWPISKQFDISNLPEIKPNIALLSTSEENAYWMEWMNRFSSLSKLQRSLAYTFRFINNSRSPNKTSGALTLTELNNALENCIKFVQRQQFRNLIIKLEKDQACKDLQSLSPFLDSRGILRVGGRLKNSPLSYEAKHPILLPTNAHFTKLLIDHLHVSYLHAGPQLLHSLISKKYWVISARRIIRSRVHLCLKCHRLRVASMTPYMADLPKSRFEQGRAFINVGVDFAGPFFIRDSHRKKPSINKCYVCIFICMSTKAVHIELVSKLSTDAFLACLDRFIARRGSPSEIFSDNGSNFVGADRRLREVRLWMARQDTQTEVIHHLNEQQIKWSFIPPAAPHFGGLWEAGVKSFKRHLVRVLGAQPLTFEEFSTVTAKIESMLNSRPLCPISSMVEDYDVLTPGHFLIGASLTEPPQPDLSELPQNRLSRWQFLQRSMQDIWKKWRLDYLNNLQQRTKWKDKQNNPTVGTLVLLRDANCPRLGWPTGRVIKTYPGQDGVVRVVKIQTNKGQYKRPVTQLAPLLPNTGN